MPEVKVEELIAAYKIEHLDLLNKLTIAKAQIASLQSTVSQQALQIEELQIESSEVGRRGVAEDDSSAVTIIG